jgi:hypothetical protein
VYDSVLISPMIESVHFNRTIARRSNYMMNGFRVRDDDHSFSAFCFQAVNLVQ